MAEYDFIVGIADSTATLGVDLFRYLGSEQKERWFSGCGG
jgi:hypothetical protein